MTTRSLPVLTTCGACGYSRCSTEHLAAARKGVETCAHPTLSAWRRTVHDKPPPDWCPLPRADALSRETAMRVAEAMTRRFVEPNECATIVDRILGTPNELEAAERAVRDAAMAHATRGNGESARPLYDACDALRVAREKRAK